MAIRPNGTARLSLEKEFRVISGELDHLEFQLPKALHQFNWWSTTAGRVSKIPASRSPNQLPLHRVDFEAPLAARSSTWQRICVNADLPRWYRMAYAPKARAPSSPSGKERAWEFESIQVVGQNRLYGQRLTPDAHLRLQVVLPDAYPVDSARCRVRFYHGSGAVDSSEEARLAKLGEDEWRRDGFRRLSNTLTLSIPEPLVDRLYQIEWAIPSTARRDRWLKTQQRRRTL
ncbi:MAG: hypothetical protein L3K03_08935 [Thermoplasmata archaeon]|nr:hypothetical protein [Thermoplasmata archaeon]